MNNDNLEHDESIADENIQRLLGKAYRPEAPALDFVARVKGEMLAEARKGSPGPWRWSRLAVAALLAVALGVTAWMALSGDDVKRDGIVLWVDGKPYVPADSINPAGPNLAPAATQELPEPAPVGLTARPLAEPPVAQRIQPGQTIATRPGERRRVVLPDGSVLYINQQTEVKIEADRRVMLMKGEVYVEVAPRETGSNGATFVVKTPDREVSALGTRFNVTAGEKGTAVMVTQGKVKVSGFDGVIGAGQQLRPEKGQVAPAPRATHALEWIAELVAAAQSPLVPASAYEGGALVVVDPNGQESRLSLRKYHIDVHIEDGFARTTIDQTYFNHVHSRQEGTFYFPLPPDASLSRLAMYVDGVLMEGGMAERDYAREVYESIVYTRRDPALLEWVDGTTFKMRVFPLEPRQVKRIIISYTQRLPELYAQAEYRFPSGHSLGLINAWSFHARVKNGADLHWSCDSDALATAKEGQDLLLDASAQHVIRDRDVVLRLRDSRQAGSGERSSFSAAEHEKSRYFMVRYRPQLPADTRRERRDWVFLMESSGSRDPLLARAQIEIIRTMLEGAEHDDRFSIVTAGTRTHAFAPEPRPATPDNVKAALAFLDRTHLIGALDLGRAFAATEPFVKAGSNTHLVHVGTGQATLGERRADLLISRLPSGAKYVGIGVGKNWSRQFMKSAAEKTAGYFAQINPDEPVAWKARELLAMLNTPRLQNVSVTDSLGRNYHLFADALAQGEELAAIVRSDDTPDPTTIKVTGTIDGRPFERILAVGRVGGNAGYLPRMWARLEIDRLLAEDAERNKPAIIALSKAMYVMSPYTSLLVLENEAMYAQFKVDRGRKDHWALYPCPPTMEYVKYEPDTKRPPVADVATVKPATKSVRQQALRQQALESILVRVPPRMLSWPNELEHPRPFGATAYAWDLWQGASMWPAIHSGSDFDLDAGEGRNHVRSLVRRAQELALNQHYERALGVINQILAIDPSNDYAVGVKQLVSDRAILSRQRTFRAPFDRQLERHFTRDEKGRIPYFNILEYPPNWGDISELRDREALNERRLGAEDAQLLAQLDRTIPEVKLNEVPLVDAVEFLRDATGANIFVNWRTLEAAGVMRDQPVSVRLRDIKFSRALEVILADAGGGQVELKHTADDGVISVSTKEEFDRVTTISVYDIRDLLMIPPDVAQPPDFSLSANGDTGRNNRDRRARTRDAGGVGGFYVRDLEMIPSAQPPNFSLSANGDTGRNNRDRRARTREAAGGASGLFDGEAVRGWGGRATFASRGGEMASEIAELIKDTIDRESWVDNGGQAGNLRFLSGQLIVTQTPENQRKLVALLDMLRASPTFRLRHGARSSNFFYQRPSFTGDSRLFNDLLHYAPGMNTTEADIEAVLAAEAPLHSSAAMGKIDPAARKLLDAARAGRAGLWKKVTLPAAGGQPEFTLHLDGAGRYAWDRVLPTGLREQVICDGKTLWHLYPELGLGAQRPASAFHEQQLTAVAPWLVLPVEMLARGADISLAGEDTVVIAPTGAAATKDDAGKPRRYEAQHLVFKDRQLIARRIVEMPSGTLVEQQTWTSSAVRIIDGQGKVIADEKLTLADAQAPSLEPQLSTLVILPMPLRTPEHVLRTRGLAMDNKSEWTDADALAMMAAALARWESVYEYAERFLQRGDRRIGFHTLMLATGHHPSITALVKMSDGQQVNLDPRKAHPASELAKYIAQQLAEKGQGQAIDVPPAGADAGLLPRLSMLRHIHIRHGSGRASDRDEKQQALELESSIAFFKANVHTDLGLAALMILRDPRWPALHHHALADAAEKLKDVPGLSDTVRCEMAGALYRAGDYRNSADIYATLYREALAVGVMPLVDPAWRDAAHQSQREEEMRTLLRQGGMMLMQRYGRRAGVYQAWQCHRFSEPALAEELLAEALADLQPDQRFSTIMAAVDYLWHTGQHARIDPLLEPLLAEKQFASNPGLWRLSSMAAAQRGLLARAIRHQERALELEFDNLPPAVDLQAIRADYGILMSRHHQLLEAMATLEQAPSDELLSRVVRLADRWRALDPDDTAACHAAASVLQRLGAPDLAWDYLTTPLAERSNESKPWADLAAQLRQQGDADLADRAYATAFDLEPTNAQVLWDRALLLHQTQRLAQAQPLFRQLAEGKWEPRFEWIQAQARRYVK